MVTIHKCSKHIHAKVSTVSRLVFYLTKTNQQTTQLTSETHIIVFVFTESTTQLHTKIKQTFLKNTLDISIHTQMFWGFFFG